MRVDSGEAYRELARWALLEPPTDKRQLRVLALTSPELEPVHAEIRYGTDSVVVKIFVSIPGDDNPEPAISLAAAAKCVEIELDEPLDGRALVDGSVDPRKRRPAWSVDGLADVLGRIASGERRAPPCTAVPSTEHLR